MSAKLPLFHSMIDQLPTNSFLLADNLYNCFEIIAKCNRIGVELLMTAKRKRNYEVIKALAEGDEIGRIKRPENNSKWVKKRRN